MNAVIKLESISYTVNSKTVLSDIDLDIYKGDVFALIGKNGAGKTTLLEVILNDLRPLTGTVTFGNEIDRKFKNVGIVYDHLPLFPLMKVREIIDYFAAIHGLRKNADYQKYVQTFGLNNLLGSFVKDLSQGERKKTGLFLSIMHNPDLLILDEPFSNIDPTVIDSIWRILKARNRTIVFTTHNWKEVEKIATKVAFMYNGKIVTPPSNVEDIMNSLPQRRKIVTDLTEDLLDTIKEYKYYINDRLLFVFYDEKTQLVDLIQRHTNNFSFQDANITDAYLYKIKDYE